MVMIDASRELELTGSSKLRVISPESRSKLTDVMRGGDVSGITVTSNAFPLAAPLSG